MAFNTVGSLLAVSSAHDTVHIFKLGGRQNSGGSRKDRPSSPLGSIDSKEADDGRCAADYDTFVDERKKSGSVS